MAVMLWNTLVNHVPQEIFSGFWFALPPGFAVLFPGCRYFAAVMPLGGLEVPTMHVMISLSNSACTLIFSWINTFNVCDVAIEY